MEALQFDLLPGLKAAASTTFKIVDSLPLPVLVLLFLACLAMLYMVPGPQPLLPLFSTHPLLTEKSTPLPYPSNPRSSYLFLDPQTNQLIPVVPSPPVATSSAPEPNTSPGRSRRKSGFRCSLNPVEEEPDIMVLEV